MASYGFSFLDLHLVCLHSRTLLVFLPLLAVGSCLSLCSWELFFMPNVKALWCLTYQSWHYDVWSHNIQQFPTQRPWQTVGLNSVMVVWGTFVPYHAWRHHIIRTQNVCASCIHSISAQYFLHVQHGGRDDRLVPREPESGHTGHSGWRHCRLAL